MPDITNPHDKFFKEALTQPGAALAFLRDYLPPDVAAQLFTPFFSTRAEGMGLGLSLCRTVIEQHGGALDFSAGAQQRGTEFRFTLPSPKAAESGETLAPVG